MIVNITEDFSTSYFSTVKSGSEYVNLVTMNGTVAIYAENKDIFYMSLIKSPFDDNTILRLPTETANMFMRVGTLEIIEDDGNLVLSHKDNNGKNIITATIAIEYCNLKDHIVALLTSAFSENSTVVMDSTIFTRALALTKASSSSIGVKGVQFKNNYAYANANGYIAYMREPTGLSLVINNSALKALANFTRGADGCRLSNYGGYNLCSVGTFTMGWRRERPQDFYDLSTIEYEYTSTLNTEKMQQLFQGVKNNIQDATISFSTGYLTLHTSVGKYSLKLDFEPDDSIKDFKLNVNIIKDLIGSFMNRVDIKITGSTLVFVNNGVHYFMGGC